MAFDKDDPAHLAALKNEVLTDPIGMGYAAVIGTTSALLALLNNPKNNVESPRPTGPAGFTAGELLTALMPINISSQDQYKIQLIFEAGQGYQDDASRYRPALVALGGTVGSAVDAIERELSRAEVMFAFTTILGTTPIIDENGVQETVQITSQDWFAARDYQP